MSHPHAPIAVVKKAKIIKGINIRVYEFLRVLAFENEFAEFLVYFSSINFHELSRICPKFCKLVAAAINTFEILCM